jgi:hypothetical protein
VEFEAEAAVESGSERFGLVVTHQEVLSIRQGCTENPGKHWGRAQVSCRKRRSIWEIRVQYYLDAGEVGRARAVEKVVRRESKALLGIA